MNIDFLEKESFCLSLTFSNFLLDANVFYLPTIMFLSPSLCLLLPLPLSPLSPPLLFIYLVFDIFIVTSSPCPLEVNLYFSKFHFSPNLTASGGLLLSPLLEFPISIWTSGIFWNGHSSIVNHWTVAVAKYISYCIR